MKKQRRHSFITEHSPLSTPAISISKVSTLQHESRNDPMEDTPLVMQWFALLPYTLLTSAKGTKILSSLGDSVTK